MARRVMMAVLVEALAIGALLASLVLLAVFWAKLHGSGPVESRLWLSLINLRLWSSVLSIGNDYSVSVPRGLMLAAFVGLASFPVVCLEDLLRSYRECGRWHQWRAIAVILFAGLPLHVGLVQTGTVIVAPGLPDYFSAKAVVFARDAVLREGTSDSYNWIRMFMYALLVPLPVAFASCGRLVGITRVQCCGVVACTFCASTIFALVFDAFPAGVRFVAQATVLSAILWYYRRFLDLCRNRVVSPIPADPPAEMLSNGQAWSSGDGSDVNGRFP